MAASQALIAIDGGYGEGGGALVRTSLVMAALTQQSVRIERVREGSKYPGLDVEDITLLKALQRMTAADLVGAEPASSVVTFLPNRRATGLNGMVEAVRTGGGRGPNANIILTALLPVLARAGVYSTVTAEGETYGNNALSYEPFVHVTLPALRQVGLYAFPELVTAGFGRESVGIVTLDVEPSVLTGIQWPDRGRLKSVQAAVVTSGLSEGVAERGVSHLKRLAQNCGVALEVNRVPVEAKNTGTFIAAWAHYDRGFGSGTAMGSRGVRMEMVAQQAFEELFAWMATPSTVDPYLADQLLLPLVLAEGDSYFTVSKLTQRFLTLVWVVKQFLPIHITIRGSEDGPGTVTIRR